MERSMPEVWNIFSIPGTTGSHPPQHHYHPAGMAVAQAAHPMGANNRRHHSHTSVVAQLHYPPAAPAPARPLHYNWPRQSKEVLMCWSDRSSACDRPRTYDRFYQKTPGNFHDPTATPCNHGKSHGSGVTETDSAISVCSSEEDKKTKNNSSNSNSKNSTQPAAGSTSAPSQRKVKKTKKKRGELQYSRTITERDVKHLERHLSMKKTIRKKMMRDLQQAFVDDPTQFTDENKGGNCKQQDSKDIIEAFDFDPRSTKRAKDENRFLEILRGNEQGSEDSGHGSPPPPGGEADPAADRTQKFRSVRERPKPRYPLLSDSSSCGGDDNSEHNHTAAAAAAAFEDVIAVATERLDLHGKERAVGAAAPAGPSSSEDQPDGDGGEMGKDRVKKKSFWQKLLGKKSKESSATSS